MAVLSLLSWVVFSLRCRLLMSTFLPTLIFTLRKVGFDLGPQNDLYSAHTEPTNQTRIYTSLHINSPNEISRNRSFKTSKEVSWPKHPLNHSRTSVLEISSMTILQPPSTIPTTGIDPLPLHLSQPHLSIKTPNSLSP